MKSKNREKWIFKDLEWEEFICEPFLKILNLDKQPCLINTCRKNCLDNLFCLNKLGESKWLNGTDDSNNESRNSFTSDTNFAAGLKNYGNTCYFNSLLQVYFNITKLREGVFRFPTDDIPDEIINYLQTIFAQMQLSIHKSVDPVELINALELPQLEQQDAPEFHSLFLNLLDERLSLIDDNILKELFNGSMGYITRCRGCGYKSTVTCLFREIDLKPMMSFDQTLRDFLKVEVLTGDNKYDCSSCSQKCDGERQTVLLKLPSLLCFQFLRYSYDSTGIKKKNCSNVTFPNHLIMDNYLQKDIKDEVNNQYIIKAILIHIGTQPSSGHYQTLIHASNEDWILYDDLNVRKLDSIDDVKRILDKKKIAPVKAETDQTKKVVKDIKENNELISSNAYMIFYEKNDSFKNNCDFEKEIDVPFRLKEHINQINQSYLSELENEQKQQEEDRIIFMENVKVITETFKELPVTICNKDLLNNILEFEFIPTEWIQNWLETCQKINKSSIGDLPVDDLEQWKSLLCVHGRLGPDIPLNKLKVVNSVGIDMLIENGFLPPLLKRRNLKDICKKCWRLKFEIKKFEYNSKNDVEIDNCMKVFEGNEVMNQKYYWISKNNLRQWRKIIRSSIESKYNDSQNRTEESKSDDSSDKEMPSVLNSDLLCSHNKLSIDKSKRTLISEIVWLKLLKYFPDNSNEYYIDFPYNPNLDEEGCQDCSQKLLYLIQKSECEKLNLTKLLTAKKRFDYNTVDNTISYTIPLTNEIENIDENVILYLIPTSFILSWKKFIKSPTIDTLITEVDYSSIYCEHGKYLVKEWIELLEDESLFILFSNEWNSFISHYSELCFEKIMVITDKTFKTIPNFVSSVTVCDTCSKEWNDERSKFDNSEIFIRLISDPNEETVDPYDEQPMRKKLKTDKGEICQKITKKKEIDLNSLRRSTRSKRHRNDTSLRISSEETILDLKVKLLQIYKVSPIDQHIIFNERELTDGTATISDVGIKPSNILHLVLDTAPRNNFDYNNTGLETGFIGTKLMESLR